MIKITKDNVLEYKGQRLLTKWYGKIEEMQIYDIQIIDDKMYVDIFRFNREFGENHKWINLTNAYIEVLGVIEDWTVAENKVKEWIEAHKHDNIIDSQEEEANDKQGKKD